MSLNQAFLKVYGQEKAPQKEESAPRRNADPAPAEERNAHRPFRADQAHLFPGEPAVPESGEQSRRAEPAPAGPVRSRRYPEPRYPEPEPYCDRQAETIPLFEPEPPRGERRMPESRRDEYPAYADEVEPGRGEDRFSPAEEARGAAFDRRENERYGRREYGPPRAAEPKPSAFRTPLSYRMGEWSGKYCEIFRRGADEFAGLADAVEEAARKGNKIFGFGGWGRSTGVTTLVLGILTEMLRRQCRILLVDANFQRPQLAETIGMPAPSLSWEEILDWRETEGAGLVRVETGRYPFYLLPLYQDGIADALAASSRKSWFHSFLELAEEFDLVLIDHGSLRTGNDREKVFELLRFGCDGYYLVTDARSGWGGNAVSLPAVSDEYRLPCFGIIENFT